MHWLAVFIVLLHLAFPLRHPLQQETQTIVDAGTEIQFGQQIIFRARIEPASALREMVVFITPTGRPTVWQPMTVNDQGLAEQAIDARQLALPPFSTVDYRFQAALLDGKLVTSETYTLRYDDTRYTWATETRENLQAHWYNGDAVLGQEILNIAEEGLRQAQVILPVNAPQPLHIYAYSSAKELQEALSLTGQNWVAGHASPELNLVLISVSSGPERTLELRRQIPHEIMHLLQYQQFGEEYTQQPAWFIEGMASLAELYPNPEYSRVLEDTARTGNLLAMETLCEQFPGEAGGAFLAYAQSESFVRFLHSTFGASALQDLMGRYADGMGCKEGVASAFGSSFNQIETRWKQEALGFNPGALALRRLLPYLFLTLLVLIPTALTFLPVRAARQRRESA